MAPFLKHLGRVKKKRKKWNETQWKPLASSKFSSSEVRETLLLSLMGEETRQALASLKTLPAISTEDLNDILATGTGRNNLCWTKSDDTYKKGSFWELYVKKTLLSIRGTIKRLKAVGKNIKLMKRDSEENINWQKKKKNNREEWSVAHLWNDAMHKLKQKSYMMET